MNCEEILKMLLKQKGTEKIEKCRKMYSLFVSIAISQQCGKFR